MEQLRQCGEGQQKALRTLEESQRQLESEHIQERADMSAHLRKSEMASAGHQREADLLRRTARQLKQEVQHLQGLLVTREREHLREQEKCRPLDGREVQEMVEREVERERAKMEGVVEQYKQKEAEQQKAYQSLEDEFRTALRIEAGRYQELKRTYDSLSGEVEACRQTAITAVQKEQRATSMVAELTAMVKEQKGRISELSRGKQEAIGELKVVGVYHQVEQALLAPSLVPAPGNVATMCLCSFLCQERVSDLEMELTTKHKLEVKVQTLQEVGSCSFRDDGTVVEFTSMSPRRTRVCLLS